MDEIIHGAAVADEGGENAIAAVGQHGGLGGVSDSVLFVLLFFFLLVMKLRSPRNSQIFDKLHVLAL